MPVGELFLSAILKVLFDRLASRKLVKTVLLRGVQSKLEKCEEALKMIEELLIDAEEKQLTDRAVKLWLDKLVDLAYDAEDVLDEFETETLRLKLISERHKSSIKILNFIRSYFTSWSPGVVIFGYRIRSKLNGISIRLEELYKERINLGLQPVAGPSTNALPPRPQSTSLPTESIVYGRDGDKAKILEMVLKNEPSDASFRVIPIVGMGGIGKTTLVQEVYNDKAMECFDLKAWVCVSDNFDVTRISKSILESFKSAAWDLRELNAIQVRLKEKVAGRKFLLVLDDVWSHGYGFWETLKSPFMAGAFGSCIIVTTRLADVALTMRPSGFYNLKLLSDEDCWSIFVRHAFEGRHIAAFHYIKLIHQKVVEKCKGLPLVARTLGGLLRSKQGDDEWLEILNSKLWELPSESEIPAVLILSYHHLPSHLKRCFGYCAMFPKDYEFEEEELILLWVAEGLIQQSSANKQLEDLSHEYFYDLLSRSLFQQASHKNASKFIMHDHVHDLAQWVSKGVSFCLEDVRESFQLEDVLESDKQSRSMEKVRHFSYISEIYDGKNKFEICSKLKNLRTFMTVVRVENHMNYITGMVAFDLLPKFKKLRILSLRCYHVLELPESVGSLKHIRYLNLSDSKIFYLPESISSLYNLQILLLKNCSLRKLPSDFQNLINLLHLDIDGANGIKEMPLGMKKLQSLRKLSNFIVGKGLGSEVKDLKDLKFLCGKICISRLENVIDYDPRIVILCNKKDLTELMLEWKIKFDDSQKKEELIKVLEMLRPHENLEKLTIRGYAGKRFPSWVGDPSFSIMTVLRLEHCVHCTDLPSLGLLRSLKHLTITWMKGLKKVGCEIYGEGRSTAFPSLETLCFEYLHELENLELDRDNEHVAAFPFLRELSIRNCSKLIGRLPDNCPSLEKVSIINCSQLVVSLSNLPVLHELNINGCKEIVCTSQAVSLSLKSMNLSHVSRLGSWPRQEFHGLEKLTIDGCDELISLLQNDQLHLKKPAKGLLRLTSLRELYVSGCSNFVSFPVARFLLNLNTLEIRFCNALTSIEGIKHDNARIEQLKISFCDSLTVITRGRLPSSLKRLHIECCEKLKYVVQDPKETSSSSVSTKANVNRPNASLVDLDISECPSFIGVTSRGQLPETLINLSIADCSNLKTLSSRGQLPKTLQRLAIISCSMLESLAESFHGNVSLVDIYIFDCENLKSLPEGLNNLTHLDNLEISECPSIVCFPEAGLPINIVSLEISDCEKLEALPNNLHSLNFLQDLTLSICPSITSFPEKGFATNLIKLSIEDLNIYKPLVEWGLHKFTSLIELEISDCLDAVSFPQEEIGMMLPSTLIYLTIKSFPFLEYLWFEGFRNLTSLEHLSIEDCPNLVSLPEPGLPSSLLYLCIDDCPLLSKRCHHNKKEWSKIVDIPCVEIDEAFFNGRGKCKFISNSELEEEASENSSQALSNESEEEASENSSQALSNESEEEASEDSSQYEGSD